jgi:hypothetical protein
MDPLFAPADAGIAPNLKPTPPAAMPEPPGASDAMASLSPFKEAQDIDAIIASLTLDRPLPLYIPDREKYPEYQFHIINDTPQEMAHAMRHGWKVVDSPELVALFEGKVSGTDKTGKITKPVLVARPKVIGQHVARQTRMKLAEMYAGMDPRKRSFNSKYADTQTVINNGVTAGNFSGAAWRIRVD